MALLQGPMKTLAAIVMLSAMTMAHRLDQKAYAGNLRSMHCILNPYVSRVDFQVGYLW
jgi:hypothetical protein